MTQSTTDLPEIEQAFFFVLQRNETGETGSHQAGEIHVRRTQLGDVFPDLAGSRSNDHIPIRLFHAQLGEFGKCTFTHWGKRSTPEDRLRQFPARWRATWEPDDMIVLIPSGDRQFFVLYHFKPIDAVPPGLEIAWRKAADATHGRFRTPTAPMR